MIIQMYTIRDIKAGAYLNPFFSRSHGEATRMISQAVKDPNSNFSKYPEDFTLLHIGEWDDSSAEMTSYTPSHITDFVSLIELEAQMQKANPEG